MQFKINTPGFRTAVAALIIFTCIALAVVVGNSGSTAPAFDRSNIPACSAPDGSTQSVCWWDSARAGDNALRGDAIVFDHGRTAYYPETGEIAVWVDEINDVIIRKIN